MLFFKLWLERVQFAAKVQVVKVSGLPELHFGAGICLGVVNRCQIFILLIHLGYFAGEA